MKKKIFLSAFLSFILIAIFSITSIAYGETSKINARAYLVADYYSGEIVESKNENERYPIASMVKITTLSLVFDAINEGKLKWDDEIMVSENAFSMGGSQAFLDCGQTYRAEELIKSVIVASANDSCVALAEHLEGSVENFVAKMNEKAKSLNMENTNYINCTGLPADGAYSSAKDVLIITRELMKNDKFFDYAKVWMYDIEHSGGRTTSLTNTNKLVRFYNGMDGGKTGFTNEALSCLSCRATRGDTSLMCVVIGSPSSKERNSTVSSLLNQGFANYENSVVVKKGDLLEDKVSVKNGKADFVECEYGQDVKTFAKKNTPVKMQEKLEFLPLSAPIKSGDVVGYKTFYCENGKEYRVELIAKNSIDCKVYSDFINDFAKKW